ncbi:MAG: bifunctional riboflavin kinase/FMN adenylyltransferase, partial [Desulfovibrionaceae bacterium]|nr:bifunctional riboflavin kinase/FMN adenylyltransferase [Desulfovibrionaceae bacterium]
HVLELPFDQALAALSPAEFVERCLMPMQVQHMVVGYDFSLGRGRSGHVDVLRELGVGYGFSVSQLPPVIAEGAVISSTRLRDHISRGDVWGASRLLGRWYGFSGTVVHGEGRGTGLGYPTANLLPPETLLPAEGVYASRLCLDGHIHAAVTNVGRKPTFDGTSLNVESFLLDSDMDLYGRQVRLEFVARLRGEQRFPSVAELTCQIGRDVAEARDILARAAEV